MSVRRTEVIRVVLAAREATERDRLREILEADGMEIAFEAVDASELLVVAQIDPPHAAVVADGAGVLESPTLLIQLRAALPDLPVVVVSEASGQRPISKALRHGASGYVYADRATDVLACTVRAAVGGMTVLPKDVRRHSVSPTFSHRERQVLDLAIRGYTNTQIANELFLAESTVKSHLSACFRKLGVSSRSEAAAALTTAG
jgi:DNA-binding NarL/FixJ family response regulator